MEHVIDVSDVNMQLVANGFPANAPASDVAAQ